MVEVVTRVTCVTRLSLCVSKPMIHMSAKTITDLNEPQNGHHKWNSNDERGMLAPELIFSKTVGKFRLLTQMIV